MKLPDLKSPVDEVELAPKPQRQSTMTRLFGGMFASQDKRDIERLKSHLAWTEHQRSGLKGNARNGA